MFKKFTPGLWRLVFVLPFILGCQSPVAADYASGEVLVKFKPGTIGMAARAFSAAPQAAAIKPLSVKNLITELGVKELRRIHQHTLSVKPDQVELADYYKMTFPKDKEVEAVIKELKKDPNVLIVQPNYLYHALSITPDDPYYSLQWGLAKIQAPAGWMVTTGTREIVVAVIDTGINYNHADLKGKVDTVNDYDFVNKDNDAMDDEGHGTSVGGVIGAITNNGVGVAGADWGTILLPLKVLKPAPEGASGLTADIIAAIDWARVHHANVMNLSLGQTTEDSLLEEACVNACNAGIVVVAAAGNDGLDQKNYPAASPSKSVLAVAATDQDDKRSVWSTLKSSNYGSWVDVSAPGTDIYSTALGGDYDYRSGTSLATPFVSGLAALIFASNTTITPAQVFQRIETYADNIDALNPSYAGKLGAGRINAFRSLSAITASVTSPSRGDYLRGTKAVYGTAIALAGFSSYQLEYLKNSSVEGVIVNSSASVEAGLLGNWDTTGLNGEYTLRLRVIAGSNISSDATVAVTIDNITPEVFLASPADQAVVEGTVTMVGTAEDTYLDYYVLEYGAGTAPAAFQSIGKFYSSINGGALGTWETAGLNGSYTLKLTACDRAGNNASTSLLLKIAASAPTKEAEKQSGLPISFALPNPFVRSSATSETCFNYTLAGNFQTTLYLFDLNGDLIWRDSYAAGSNGGKAGNNNPSWDGRNLYNESVPNGVYLYQVTADQKVIARGKIIVLN